MTNDEKLLEGKIVNLRIIEKEDLQMVAEWLNNLDFFGEHNPSARLGQTCRICPKPSRARATADNVTEALMRSYLVSNEMKILALGFG